MWNRLQFFGGILVAFAICVGLWASAFSRMLGYRMEGNAINIAAWYDKKDALAKQIPSPRLILVGGSNVFYGLNAKQLSDALGVPVLNYGTHGGLTLSYLLYRVRKIARPGDLIILTLEYEMFRRTDALNATAIEYFIGGDAGFIATLDFPQRMQCYFTPSPLSLMTFRRASPENYQARLEKQAKDTDSLMNENGDRRGHTRNSMTEANKETIRKLKPPTSVSMADLTEKEFAWHHLAEFAEWCKKHHVTLTAGYANTIEDPLVHLAVTQENLIKIRTRYERLGVHVFGDGNEGFRPRSDFFDTTYHLNEEGQAERTADFIKIIRPYVEQWKLQSENLQ